MDFPFIYPTQQTEKTAYCVLEAKCIPELPNPATIPCPHHRRYVMYYYDRSRSHPRILQGILIPRAASLRDGGVR